MRARSGLNSIVVGGGKPILSFGCVFSEMRGVIEVLGGGELQTWPAGDSAVDLRDHARGLGVLAPRGRNGASGGA
jgi:hypothetical protein